VADASAFASIFDKDSLLAGGTDPGEVAEEGEEVVLEESDALGSRELAAVAFCAFHRSLRWARLAQPHAGKSYGGRFGLDCRVGDFAERVRWMGGG
jgi:hypothetical protein